MAIINKVKEVANKRGITSANALADATGLAYNTAHGIYTGRSNRIDMGTLSRLCATLEAQPGDLFVWDGKDEERPK